MKPSPSGFPPCSLRLVSGEKLTCLHPEISSEVQKETCAACALRINTTEAIPEELLATAEIKPGPATEARGGGITSMISRGAVGLAKSFLHIDRPSEEVIEKRWAICENCEFYKHWQCTVCGCIASQKVKVASESCPKGYWKAEVPGE